MSDLRTDTRDSALRGTAQQGARSTKEAAGRVSDTATEQTRRVAGEITARAQDWRADVRRSVAEQARTQSDRLADNIRQLAGDLRQMAKGRDDSPVSPVVARVADGGQRLADYLAQSGPQGALDEVQEFARRRPGVFLGAALAAGFVLGRLGKSALAAGREPVGGATSAISSSPVDRPAGGQHVGQPAPQWSEPDPYPAETAGSQERLREGR